MSSLVQNRLNKCTETRYHDGHNGEHGRVVAKTSIMLGSNTIHKLQIMYKVTSSICFIFCFTDSAVLISEPHNVISGGTHIIALGKTPYLYTSITQSSY